MPARCRRSKQRRERVRDCGGVRARGRIRRHAPAEILEQQPGCDRKPQAPLFEERVGHGGADPPRAQADAAATGPRGRRAPQRSAASRRGRRAAPFLQHHRTPPASTRVTLERGPCSITPGPPARERALVRRERAAAGSPRRSRCSAVPSRASATQARVAAAGPARAARAAARIGARARVDARPDRAQAPARGGGERARESQRSRREPHAVAAARASPRASDRARPDRAGARRPRAAAQRGLQVEQPDAVGADQQVAVVQVAMGPARGVQARDQVSDGVQPARGGRRAARRAICFSVRPSSKRVAITSSPSGRAQPARAARAPAHRARAATPARATRAGRPPGRARASRPPARGGGRGRSA